MENKIKYLLLTLLLPLFSCTPEGGESGGGDTPDPTPVEWTVSGNVRGDDNKPLANVVVSDGRVCVKTDAQGNYAIPVDLSGDLTKTLQYIFVSTPSGWAAPMTANGPVFWEWLKDHPKNAEGKITGVDFTLKKIDNPNRFTVFFFGDPQPRKDDAASDQYAYHSLNMCDDMFKDMGELAATLSDHPVYGVGLGDICHRYLKFLPIYRQKMASAGVTCYSVIGNHDQVDESNNNPATMTDEESSKSFERRMGPTNYSFNLGNLHFLMLDNMIIDRSATNPSSDGCLAGLTDDIWTFVQNDLKMVPSDATIMVCAHSPMFQMPGGYERSGPHLSDLRNLLKQFDKVHGWAGHTHSTFNYYNKANPKIETHTLSRVTGALWTNEYLGENGTPRGYVVLDYDGGQITWRFKPTYWQTTKHIRSSTPAKVPAYTYRDWDYDATGRAVMKGSEGQQPLGADYQMQVFAPGTYAANDQTIYVDVFLWDEAWETPSIQLKGETLWRPMTRMTSLFYSWADRDIRHFYATAWTNLWKDWYGENYTGTEYPDSKKTNCASMFKYVLNTAPGSHSSGIVKVKDRFGNEYRSSVKW